MMLFVIGDSFLDLCGWCTGRKNKSENMYTCHNHAGKPLFFCRFQTNRFSAESQNRFGASRPNFQPTKSSRAVGQNTPPWRRPRQLSNRLCLANADILHRLITCESCATQELVVWPAAEEAAAEAAAAAAERGGVARGDCNCVGKLAMVVEKKQRFPKKQYSITRQHEQVLLRPCDRGTSSAVGPRPLQ